MTTELENRARENLAVIHSNARIPERVFASEYSEIYVMDDRCLHSSASKPIAMLQSIMELEGSSCVAIGCLEIVVPVIPGWENPVKDWRDDLFFVGKETGEEDYHRFIRRNILEVHRQEITPDMRMPWTYGFVFGACSERANWVIFSQINADIALLGLKNHPGERIEKEMFAEWGIAPLSRALNDEAYEFYFGKRNDKHAMGYRAKLASNYLK